MRFRPDRVPGLFDQLSVRVWSRSFFVLPLTLPLIAIAALKLLASDVQRPGSLKRLNQIGLIWAFAAPTGFAIWLLAWKTAGAGAGLIPPLVTSTAVVGWCAWHYGVVRMRRSNRIRNSLIAASALFAMMLVYDVVPAGAMPIALALTAILCELTVWLAGNFHRSVEPEAHQPKDIFYRSVRVWAIRPPKVPH